MEEMPDEKGWYRDVRDGRPHPRPMTDELLAVDSFLIWHQWLHFPYSHSHSHPSCPLSCHSPPQHSGDCRL